jgi:single-stranded-DNA-specific exonuclease
LINPKIPDDPYPCKHLAGAGVVYKLVCALAYSFPEIIPSDYIDLVAIGTVADVVPLVGENRYLVLKGLAAINDITRRRQSLSSLIGAANLSGRNITSSDISYQIAPRLNASGRLDSEDPEIPLKLLLSSDLSETGILSQELENHNHKRKSLSRELQTRIESHLDLEGSRKNLIISLSESNHLGVAGIAAGYLARKYHAPAIVGQIGPDFTIASCRSIPEFDIVNALDKQADLFERYGGHKMAAGFTIKNEKLDVLEDRIKSEIEKELSGMDLRPSLDIDAIISFDQITPSLVTEIKKLEPTGAKNPQPIFMSRNINYVRKSIVGKNGDHLRLTVNDGSFTFNAIGFGLGKFINSIEYPFEIAYRITENHYQGKTEIQLQIEDIRSQPLS